MRRIPVLLLSVVMLLGSLLIGQRALVSAQDATPQNFSGHPLIGSWVLDTDTEDPSNLPSLVMFTADGSYVEIASDRVDGLGTWAPTGETTATLTFWSVDDEQGGFEIRANIEVAPDGQTLTATYTFELFDPVTGKRSGQYGPGTATGMRTVIEAPGTPIGSIQDLFSQFQGTPEASPAP